MHGPTPHARAARLRLGPGPLAPRARVHTGAGAQRPRGARRPADARRRRADATRGNRTGMRARATPRAVVRSAPALADTSHAGRRSRLGCGALHARQPRAHRRTGPHSLDSAQLSSEGGGAGGGGEGRFRR